MRALPFRRILAATDLTESSDRIVEGAGRLAERVGAELHLVHAFDLEGIPRLAGRPAGLGFPDRLDLALRELGAQARRVLGSSPALTSAELVIRTPSIGIAERAAAVGADLVVLGANARFTDGMLGSTAERVLRSTDLPCLVLRAPLDLPIRRVVAAQDLAEPAPAALREAFRWAAGLSDECHFGVPQVVVDVVHVLPPVSGPEPFPFEQAVVGPEPGPTVRDALGSVRGAEKVEVREELVWGDDPAGAIAAFARRVGAELVVMATHGRGPMLRVIRGSVAAEVVARATAAVLLVPSEPARRPVTPHLRAEGLKPARPSRVST